MSLNLAAAIPTTSSSDGKIKSYLEHIGSYGAGDHDYYFTVPANAFVSVWCQHFVGGKPEIQDSAALFTKSLQVKEDGTCRVIFCSNLAGPIDVGIRVLVVVP